MNAVVNILHYFSGVLVARMIFAWGGHIIDANNFSEVNFDANVTYISKFDLHGIVLVDG